MQTLEERKKKKLEYNKIYNKRTEQQITLHFQKANDSDVIDMIQSQANKVGYIRDLVRADIAKSNKI